MLNPNEIRDFRPPTWMGRREKRAFNSVQKLRKSRNSPLKETEIPVLIEYVRTMVRIETLQAIFDDDDRRMRTSRDASVKSRLIATARQIDASTKLAQGLWDRLICTVVAQ
ncbi:hypothetical protein [Paenirhodobacter populi]|uniref:Uncharacterized protein n=1 Tax=Paenirhodobacter populi TaxID=2306993 RepID=A0A443IPJ7_9RHOB|nr:hypothetical protein [Sinirhodobacter populi]RWR08488.1 hypothetical protein D2T33_15445 [Sinirhodobacter populi]